MTHRRTRAIEPHCPRSSAQRSVALPIHQTTTFVMDAALEARMEAGDYRSAYLYTRMGNPTVDALATRLACLHGAQDCVLTASGMAAISCALIALVPAGSVLLADRSLYGVTLSFLDRYFLHMGRRVELVDFHTPSALDTALAAAESENDTWLLVETVSNPMLDIAPLGALAEKARSAGAKLMVDNTFANPMTCRPLEHGADIVLESLSKSIAGHSDAHGGAILGNQELIEPCWEAMVHFGPCLDPHTAWLIDRGLRTLPLRTDASSSNALKLARQLVEHPEVTQVRYPGLSADPSHVAASAQMENAGSMITFSVRGDDERALRFIHALRLITPASSLGGVESLVSLPANTSHRNPRAREAVRLPPGTVRFSVGCESADDLWDDIERALALTHPSGGANRAR